jgi:hypothetical protein
MQLSIINIENGSGDRAFLINDDIIITRDLSEGEAASDIDEVADNTSTALHTGLTIINFDVTTLTSVDDWTWDDVLISLRSSAKIPSPSAVSIIHQDVIQDWMCSECGDDESELDPKNIAKYDIRIEKSNNTGQLWLSIVNSEVNKLSNDTYKMGLYAFIEIRDGVPAMSIGIQPDCNIIHVMSNTSTELAVIKECDDNKPTWMKVDFCDAKHTGLCFTESDNVEYMFEIRQELLGKALANYDFGCSVKDTGGWEQINDDVYEMAVFLDQDDAPSEMTKLTVTFQPHGAHIISAITQDI